MGINESAGQIQWMCDVGDQADYQIGDLWVACQHGSDVRRGVARVGRRFCCRLSAIGLCRGTRTSTSQVVQLVGVS